MSDSEDEPWLLPHIILSAVIRFSLVLYGLFHDQVFTLKYTDVDYSVFTDGALFVSEGRSPFLRNGYRYSPLMAVVVLPNIYFTRVFGKLVFVLFDLLTGYMIYKVLEKLPRLVSRNAMVSSCLLWFYNPLPIVVSTRGSSDSIQTFLVLLLMYLLTTRRTLLAGLVFGLAIHVKLYPVIYVFAIFFVLRRQPSHHHYHHHSLKEKGSKVDNEITNFASSSRSTSCLIDKLSPGRDKVNGDNFKKNLWIWNPFTKQRMTFFFSAMVSFTVTTGLAYHLYGLKYINEAWIYHFTRKDSQHNFSIYFYLYHLGFSPLIESFIARIAFIPQILVIIFTVKWYLLDSIIVGQRLRENSASLSVGEQVLFAKFLFACFCQTFMFVHLNKVITSQYFLWYLCLFPLTFPFLHGIFLRGRQHLVTLFWWLTGQGIWLLTAYLLEFRRMTALLPVVWTASLLFLSINMWIIHRFQTNFNIVSTIVHQD